jgi:hypothetical protein
MKLKPILNTLMNEVGEGTSQPFEYRLKSSTMRTTSGERGLEYSGVIDYAIEATSKGENLEVILSVVSTGNQTPRQVRREFGNKEIETYFNNKPYVRIFDISFAINEPDTNNMILNYGTIVNDKVYMFRLMATIKQILLPLIEKYQPDAISYSSENRPKEIHSNTAPSRHNLYKRFIEKSVPVKKILTGWEGLSEYLFVIK